VGVLLVNIMTKINFKHFKVFTPINFALVNILVIVREQKK